MLQGFGVRVQADRERRRAKARPFFPSGLPHSDAPRRGFRLEGCVDAAATQAIECESLPSTLEEDASRGLSALVRTSSCAC
jgi:hypothetical protein